MLGGALGINAVVDEERRLSFINFGEIVASHAKAGPLSGTMPRCSPDAASIPW